jgi:hypothetical protein
MQTLNMKRIYLSFLLSAFCGLALSAQKTINDPNVEKRTTESFHGIEVSTGIELLLSPGSQEAVAVSAATNEFRDKIITRVEKGILKIYYENKLGSINNKKEKKHLKAYVSCQTLDRLDANTGAQVIIDGQLKAKKLEMKVNTGAIVKGKIDVEELDINQATGSVVTLDGLAGQLVVDGDTGSMFKGNSLESANCTATSSTGAGIYISVQKELNARANTGGFIKYSGQAGIREIKTNTGGSVSKI